MRFTAGRRAAPEINLTPLIDILFIVMTFLVLTTTFRQSTSIGVSLPRAETGERDRTSEPGRITIVIAADGQLYLAETPIELRDLFVRLQQAEPSDTEVVLAADEKAAHGRVVAVMDCVRRSGLRRMRIETVEPRATP